MTLKVGVAPKDYDASVSLLSAETFYCTSSKTYSMVDMSH